METTTPTQKEDRETMVSYFKTLANCAPHKLDIKEKDLENLILSHVTKATGVSRVEMQSASQLFKCVSARRLVYVFLAMFSECSYEKMGNLFGQNHATVHSSLRVHYNRCKQEAQYCNAFKVMVLNLCGALAAYTQNVHGPMTIAEISKLLTLRNVDGHTHNHILEIFYQRAVARYLFDANEVNDVLKQIPETSPK